MSARRDENVFINCPFDQQFADLLGSLVFVTAFCGFTVRSALEISDSGDLRLAKIVRLMEQSRFSIHDISRVELDPASGLPRFNMPIELGMALGMKHLGRSSLRNHHLLILDTEKYRYLKFASDLAGFDIAEHGGDPTFAIRAVRDFLAGHTGRSLPTAAPIVAAYNSFLRELPKMARSEKRKLSELTFTDRLRHMQVFLLRFAA